MPGQIAPGFSFKDFLAVAGPERADRLVALWRALRIDGRPGQWKA